VIAENIEKEMIDKDTNQIENIKKIRNFDRAKIVFLKKDQSGQIQDL
jgi:hypothetical protein